MAIQPIRFFGDPVLTTPASPVVDFDKELRVLVKDLTETMIDAPGAGLAAPQIGVPLRVFVWSYKKAKRDAYHFQNSHLKRLEQCARLLKA
jgi:peptide deformylase